MVRSTSLGVGLVAVAAVMASATPAYGQSRQFDIPAGELKAALKTYIRQSAVQLIYRADDVRGKSTRGVSGAMSADAALDQLLAGTGLTATRDSSGAVMVGKDTADAARSDGVDTVASQDVIVTGSNIRGATPDSSPLQIINRKEMDARGVTTAEELVNTLTQNFNSVNSSGVSASRNSFFNAYASNGVDLRGLGPGTSLVLLNGRRLAGASEGEAVDISMIPLAAIDRVEVLTDSASSVYGSDAVGGVVNFILRDSFHGIETRASYGSTGDGALDEIQGEATTGINWSSGHAIISGNFMRRTALLASERSFSDTVGGTYDLVPPEKRYGAFIGLEQSIGSDITLHSDFLYSHRDASATIYRDLGVYPGLGHYTYSEDYDGHTDQYFGDADATWHIQGRTYVDLVGSISIVRADQLIDETTSISPLTVYDEGYRTETYDITAKLGGALVDLPGGAVLYSVGGGLTRETLNDSEASYEERTTRYAYGELQVPIFGADQNIPMLHRLEINASVRYSDYSDFGQNTSPKVGVLWSPVEGMNFRASYGQAFRAPNLVDLGSPNYYEIDEPLALGVPDPLTALGHPPVANPVGLYTDEGTEPNLGPEKSRLFSAGFDFKPAPVPHLTISGTYFHIQYDDRIAHGDTGRGTGYYLDPAAYPELYNFAPTRAEVAAIVTGAHLTANSDPAIDATNIDSILNGIDYILDNRLQNIASSEQDDIDLSLDYSFSRGDKIFALGASTSYILDYISRTTPSSQPLTQVDQLGKPASLRATGYVQMAGKRFSTRLTGYYVGSYANPYTPAYPRISAWLTFDLTASYDFPAEHGPLAGTTLQLTVKNLLNSDPPFVADIGAGVTDGLSEPIGHDPANANALKRFLQIEIRKRF